MSCLRTTQLTDSELLMALDGEADLEVTMHIADCPDCRARAGQLQKLENRLTSRHFRADCPSSLDVGEYQLGMLAGAQALAIEKHLATCTYCSDERALLAGFLAEPGSTAKTDLLAPAKETLRILVARLTTGFTGGLLSQPNLAPAMAGLRGVEDGPLMYEAEEVQVMAEVLDDTSHPGRKALLGLLTGIYQAHGFRAYLWLAATHCATVLVNDLGNFAIDNLTPGDYSLVLSGPDMKIHLDHVQVHAH